MKGWQRMRQQRGFFRSRPLMCLSVCYVAGILCSQGIEYRRIVWLAALFLLLLGAGLKKLRIRILPFLIALLAFFSLGFQMASWRRAEPQDIPALGEWTVQGTLQGEIGSSEKGIWFILQNVQVKQGEEWKEISEKVYCFVSGKTPGELRHGQRIEISGDASWPQEARNPGEFNQKQWLLQQGAKVALYAREKPEILKEAGFSLQGAALEIRRVLAERMDLLFGGASPVVRAMVLGDTGEMPDTWESWLESGGMSHLLAVSGLHVYFWYALLLRPIRPLGLSLKAKWRILAFFLAFYALVTGLRASVLRAALMLLISQAALPAGRKNDPLTSLAAAALLILLFRPMDVYSAGFQMSFGAVLGLLLLGPEMRKMCKKKWWEAFTATACAQLGALPAVSRCYGRISLLSLFTNLAAVPLAGMLIPAAVVSMIASVFFLPLGKLLAWPVRGMTWALLALGRATEGMWGSALRIPAFAPWSIAALYGGMYFLSSGISWKAWQRTMALALTGALACGAGVVFYRSADRYIQLDVGQALSGVLQVDGRCFVYDCGRKNSALAEYLLWNGDEVDALFLSHPHSDHIGGLLEVLEEGVEVKAVYVPVNAQAYEESSLYEECLQALEQREIPVMELKAGDEVRWGDTVFEVIAPKEETGESSDTNDRSLVLKTQIHGSTLLLCGDSDGIYEPGADCDVLQVAHHASASAADWRVLSKMTPQVALISTGENTYGHPHPATVKRLEESGAQIYDTRLSGAVTVYFQKDGPLAEEYIR